MLISLLQPLSIPSPQASAAIPLGVQVIGAPRSEARLLTFARALESELGFRHQWPVIIRVNMSYHDTRSMVAAPWDLDALKNEFEELILLDAPIEITGFSPAEIDHVILGDVTEG